MSRVTRATVTVAVLVAVGTLVAVWRNRMIAAHEHPVGVNPPK